MIPARPRQNNKKQKLVTSLVPQAKQSTSVLQNHVELGLTVRLNDLQHSPDEKDRHLLSLPARMTQALFEEFYGLYERLIESQQYEVLESPLMTQYMVFNIDEARQFQISLLVLKNLQIEYARQEADKLRLLWSYFMRFANEPDKRQQWSHATHLNRLKLKYEYSASQRQAMTASSLLDILPCPPIPGDSDDESLSMPSETEQLLDDSDGGPTPAGAIADASNSVQDAAIAIAPSSPASSAKQHPVRLGVPVASMMPLFMPPASPKPRSGLHSEILHLISDSDDEGKSAPAARASGPPLGHFGVADALLDGHLGSGYDHIAHSALSKPKKRKKGDAKDGDTEKDDKSGKASKSKNGKGKKDDTKKDGKSAKSKSAKKAGKSENGKSKRGRIGISKSALEGTVLRRIRGKQTHVPDAPLAAPAAPVAPPAAAPMVANVHNGNGLEVDFAKKRWILQEYPHIQTDTFQNLLFKSAFFCGESTGERDYASKVVVTYQRKAWTFQIMDGESKHAIVQFNHRSFDESKNKAMMATMVLLALYNAGATQEQLQEIKGFRILKF